MIRRTIFSFVIFMTFIPLFSQGTTEANPSLDNFYPDPAVYVGISTGINYGGLVAFTTEFNIVDNLALAGSAGLGTWGYKLLGNLRYYKDYAKGLYYAGGLSYATGLPEVPVQLQTTGSNGSTEDVRIEMLSVYNIDFGLGYAWRLGSKGRINLEMGYAADVTQGDAYRVISMRSLTDTSKKVMSMMKPGGVRIGLGLNVGL